MKNYGVDKNGFIITEVGLNKVKPTYKKPLNEIKNLIIREFDGYIASVYLYGSVATGKAQMKISDLDLLLVLKQKPTSKIKKETEDFAKNLSRKYKIVFRDIGISLTHANEVKKDIYGWGCFIKHLCVCLYGENLEKNLPKFKPSKKVAKAFNGDIGNHIKTILKKLPGTNARELGSICSSTMRKIVRTGFCLVMEKEQSWTTDLKKSYEIFSKYYPKQSMDMKKALTLAQKPTTNRNVLGKFLEDFGSWLIKEVKKKL